MKKVDESPLFLLKREMRNHDFYVETNGIRVIQFSILVISIHIICFLNT